jgi:hypothetical protein
MEEFDDYGRPYVDANSWVRKESISLLSGFEGLQYKFKKNAMSYCTNVWDIDFYQLRVAVLNHLQQNLRILKKYKNNTRVFLDNTYEMNVSLPKVNKTILGRFYAEITLESSLIYLGAHNHNNTNKLPY